jgi:hypothetical protein
VRSSFVIGMLIVAGQRGEVNSHAVARARLRPGRESIVRKLVRRVFRLGLLAGIGYAVWKYFEKQRSEPAVGWEAQPFPYPPQPRERAEEKAPASRPLAGDAQPGGAKGWVEPNGDTCPATHPVKAKLSSKIFHVPGGLSYDRTKPDRCYRDEAAAEADGLRKAAR